MDGSDLAMVALRMIAGLAVVLALLWVTAWLSRRVRFGARAAGGHLEVLSGMSLGSREKVVLLRVGREQVLVGVGPGGMRTLHVLREPPGDGPTNGMGAPAAFAGCMEQLR